MTTSRADLPIGIFDSGVGGVTVLRALRECLPGERLLYLGDTARLPYGTKSRETITQYCLQASAKLMERGVKMLVVACNTATAAALPALRAAYAPVPVIGVVEPGSAAAARVSVRGRICVIATEATIRSRAYQEAILRRRPDAVVTGRSCTLFVPLAEEGWMDGPLVEGIAARYLEDIFGRHAAEPRPDTLVLGCTHFPLLKNALRHVVGDDVSLVDSAATTAEAVREELMRADLRRAAPAGEIAFLTTDDPARFARTGSLFLGQPIAQNAVELVDLQGSSRSTF